MKKRAGHLPFAFCLPAGLPYFVAGTATGGVTGDGVAGGTVVGAPVAAGEEIGAGAAADSTVPAGVFGGAGAIGLVTGGAVRDGGGPGSTTWMQTAVGVSPTMPAMVKGAATWYLQVRLPARSVSVRRSAEMATLAGAAPFELRPGMVEGPMEEGSSSSLTGDPSSTERRTQGDPGVVVRR
jgi:hypothetical protein